MAARIVDRNSVFIFIDRISLRTNTGVPYWFITGIESAPWSIKRLQNVFNLFIKILESSSNWVIKRPGKYVLLVYQMSKIVVYWFIKGLVSATHWFIRGLQSAPYC